jgi:hypothetical protein
VDSFPLPDEAPIVPFARTPVLQAGIPCQGYRKAAPVRQLDGQLIVRHGNRSRPSRHKLNPSSNRKLPLSSRFRNDRRCVQNRNLKTGSPFRPGGSTRPRRPLRPGRTAP